MVDRETSEVVLLAESVRQLLAALPAAWSATINTDLPSTSHAPDAVLTITSPAGPSAAMAVQVRRLDRGDVATAVSRATMMRELTGRPVVIVTEYANPALRHACRQADVSYLDPTGWIQLRSDQPPLFISAQGTARPPRKAQCREVR